MKVDHEIDFHKRYNYEKFDEFIMIEIDTHKFPFVAL